jgi:NhaP-type Na+/H+ and K+/H+ antiporter
MKVLGEPLEDSGIKYVTSRIKKDSQWVGLGINEITLMPDMVPVMIVRGNEKLPMTAELRFEEDDLVIIAVNSLN